MEKNKMTNVLIKTLKQHTPLLHFSPLEPGSTLRASEVKPKLDRYLIKKLGGGDYDSVKQQVRTNNPDWFVKKEGVYALNYQLKIIAEGRNESITIGDVKEVEKKNNETQIEEKKLAIANYPLVLSNMGGRKLGEEEKFANFSFYEYIRLVFIFPTEVNGQKVDVEGLYKEINDNIAEFFFTTNFGQRSGKGFGSFTVVGGDDKVLQTAPYIKYAFDGKIDNKTFKTLFTVIDYYWKRLKSGVNNTRRGLDKKNNIIRNNPNNYYKAFVYRYLNDKKIGIGLTWEKKSIKEGLPHDLISAKTVSDNWKEVENKNDAFFARAHLGGPGESIQYRVATGRIGKVKDKDGNLTDKEVISDKTLIISNNHSKELARIPSPIVFKPIVSGTDVIIYLLIDENILRAIEALPRDTEFTFSIKDEENKKTSVNLFACRKGETEKYIFNYRHLIQEFHESEKKLTVRLSEQVKEGQNFKTIYTYLDVELSKTDNE